MAHFHMTANHSALGSAVNPFQSAALTCVADELRKLPDHDTGEERAISLDATTLQGIQKSQDDYETILVGRIVEAFEDKVVVLGFLIMTGEAVMADSIDDDIAKALHTGIEEAGRKSAEHVTIERQPWPDKPGAQPSPFDMIQDMVRRAQQVGQQEAGEES